MLRKMKQNKILITIEDISIIDDLKKLGIEHFVFPLKGFCVGIPNTFLVNEINTEGFIYLNRILDNKGIDELKKIKEDIINNSFIKGIIFDDLGILNIFKDTKLEKILYLSHFLSSSLEINEYLKYVDTVILSTDITLEELKSISANAIKKISLFTFGLVSTMYSRRLLITNYTKYHNLESTNKLIINNNNDSFILYENEYGTMVYYDKYLYDKNLWDIDALYYFYHPIFLSSKDVLSVLNENFDNIKTDTGFLYKETIYKIKECD